jgi:histidine phosphotransferase ChpT
MTNEPDALDLAAMLCSRICHDVVNPVGAITNGLEVLDEGDESLGEIALDLIRKSAEQASAKLQFARVAFGASSTSGATLDLGDAEIVARQIIDEKKVRFAWSAPRLALPKDEVKLLLNLVLVALATIPRGGTLTVEVTARDGAHDLRLVTEGMNSRIPPDIEQAVTGKQNWSAVDAHSIQPYYTGLIARSAGMQVRFECDGERIVISATKG